VWYFILLPEEWKEHNGHVDVEQKYPEGGQKHDAKEPPEMGRQFLPSTALRGTNDADDGKRTTKTTQDVSQRGMY
jgi:hypothetical protein